MAGALLAGSAAALLSLPLRSPHDALLNSASVTWGVLALSVLGGLLWRRLRRRRRGRGWFAVAMAAGFAAWTVAAFAGETMLERMVSFTVPLAAIGFGGVAALTPGLSKSRLASLRLAPTAAVVAAAAVGIGLAGFGDMESGRLELPPRGSAVPDVVAQR